MTIAQALARLTSVKPSQFTDADKIAWLSQLDGQIFEEIIKAHQGAPETGFTPYTEDTPGETALLVPSPYDKLYVDFLCAQVDFYNAEYARYNNTMRRFETDYQEFSDWYNREHAPLQGDGIRMGSTAEKSLLPKELEG